MDRTRPASTEALVATGTGRATRGLGKAANRALEEDRKAQ